MYTIQMSDGRKWVALGGSYRTKEEAEQAVTRFRPTCSKKKPRYYRVVAG